MLERAPEQERGGDTAFTAGAMRVVYDSVDHLRELVRDLSDAELATTDFGVYPASAFYDDMARVTQYRADPDLVEALVERSHATLRWMADLVRGLPGDLRHHVHLRRPADHPDKAEVVSNEGRPIRGLYAAGEIIGGLFFHNYPGGTGLTAGSVFGRMAGEAAAELSGR